AAIHPRKLNLYGGLYGAQIRFRAYLSDLSAPAYYSTLANVYDTVDAMFTVQFASALPNQMLFVRVENQVMFDNLFGNLRLMTATLQTDDTILLPITLINPMRVGDDFLFSFQTLSNHIYTVEYLDDITDPAWVALTNLPGTDGTVTITDAISPDGARF